MLPEAADMAQNCPLWRMLSTYGAILQLHARNNDDDDLTKMINDTALHSELPSVETYGTILQLHARNDDDDLTKMINDTALHSVFLILQEHAGHSPG